jgi:hypothetical protein
MASRRQIGCAFYRSTANVGIDTAHLLAILENMGILHDQ